MFGRGKQNSTMAHDPAGMTSSLYVHDLANPTDDASLVSFIGRMAANARDFQRRMLPLAPSAGVAPAVAYTYTNIAYEAAFDNWLHCVSASFATPVIVAMDRATVTAFASRNISAVLFNDSVHKPLKERSLYIKAEVTQRLLSAGLKLIFSEMDIFWLHDPQLIEDRTIDLQVWAMHI